ncbi:MAG: M23 family metallopeptidase [Chloroflexi bacterium]|nr:M23 family metallopeptidase [Chloroflexota bacterium]
MRRRVLLVAAAAAPVLAAPGIWRVFAPDGKSATTRLPGTQAAAADTSRIPIPGIAFDGYAAHVEVSRLTAYQGGAVRVTIDKASSGTANLLGRTYDLAPAGAGLEGYIPFGIDDPPGSTVIDIDYINAYQQPERTPAVVTILKTDWTVDYIVFPPPPPPDPNAPPPPPPPPDETNLLPVVYAGRTPRKWRPGWGLPLPAPLVVSSYFGEQRSYNGGPVGGHHGGTDLAADAGTPVYASNDGVVVMAGLYFVRGYLSVIDHGGGIMSSYGHQKELLVAKGQSVTKGQTIGYVGSSGQSTGPHVHWEISVAGIVVDALRWTDGSQGF